MMMQNSTEASQARQAPVTMPIMTDLSEQVGGNVMSEAGLKKGADSFISLLNEVMQEMYYSCTCLSCCCIQDINRNMNIKI